MKLFRCCILLAVVVAVLGCSAMRKAKAGSILSQMKISISGWTLITATVDSSLFPKIEKASNLPIPNPQIMKLANDLLQGKTTQNLGTAYVRSTVTLENPGKDSVWIARISGKLRLDSIMEATWHADSIYKIGPGKNPVPVEIRIPLDSRLFHILEAESLYVQGELFASLEPNGEEVYFQFSKTRESPRAEIKAFAENSKKTILDALLNGWARSIM